MASQDGILAAWAVGEGIIIYRIIAREHRAPVPGELLGSSGAFVLLALLGQYQPELALSLAVGLDLAGWLNLAGSGVIGTALSGPSSVATAAAAGGADAASSDLTTGPRTGAPGGPLTPRPRAGAGLGTAAAAAASGAAAAGRGFLSGLGLGVNVQPERNV